MSIFSKIGHAFEHLGDDIKHVAKDVEHGVENIGKDIKQGVEHLDPFANTKIGEGIEHAFAKIGKGIKDGVEEVGKGLAKDASTVVKDVKKTGHDLAHGHFKQAFHDAVDTGKDAFNGYYDAVTAVGHAAVDSLADMHLSKGMDKAMGKVEKGYNAFTNDIKSSVDQVGSEVVEGTVGAISSTIQAGKDAVHGKWGAALDKLGEAGMDTLSVASDLTPEGAMAAVGTNALINAHIGNAQLDTVIGGALHGNVAETAKGIAKGVGEMEAGNVAQKALGGVESKIMSTGGGSDSSIVAASVLGAAAGGAGGFSFGRKGSHESFGGSGGSGGSGKFGKFASFGKFGGGSGGSGGSGLSSHFPTLSKLGQSGKFGGKTNTGGQEELHAGHAGAGSPDHANYAARGAEDEHEKKQQRADNAQNAADNAAANNTASNTAPGGMSPMPFMMPPQAPGAGRSASLVGGDDSSSSSNSSPTSHSKA
ncbi:hypothetical protein C0Z18_05855 [Trinickia dabaoshanensis]|uniref:Uncharacterized protein n=1 Tax=Trinickia dabaoshanensis TaxID=564714 RepID=A0A2N7VY38_9BURK|nr:hypothetical protein [Trinickia dabaoshanensis]PMS22040.1 hypothetical protein C0Z18_05855 [Trinickia dabaoshanensis]